MQVPSVVGQGRGTAINTLEGLGFVVAFGDAIETADESLNNVVASQSTTDWLPVGSTVTITVYTYVEPPPDDGDGGG